MNTEHIAGNNTSGENKQRFGLVKIILTIVIAVLIGVLSTPGMYTNNNPPTYRLPVFAAMVALVLLFSVGRIGKFSPQRLLLLFLWGGFAAMALISGLINGEDMLALLWLAVGVPYLIFCVFPQVSGREGNMMVLLAMVLAFTPYVAASLLLYPLTSPYPGVFENSNGFGMAVVTLSAALFGLLRGAIASRSKSIFHWTWIGILFLMLAGFLIIMSNSRTSLLTYAVLVSIFIWSLFLDAYKNRWWIGVTAAVLLATVAFFLASGLSDNTRTNYMARIIDKMETKIDAGDVSGGRFGIWQSVIDDFELFGKGTVSFPQNYGGNAHNTYLMILGSLGPIALIFLVGVHGLAIALAYRRVVRDIRQDGYALGPLLVVMNYMVLGLAELVFGILGNGINMSFLLMLGVLVNETPSIENSLQYAPAENIQPVMSSRLESELQ